MLGNIKHAPFLLQILLLIGLLSSNGLFAQTGNLSIAESIAAKSAQIEKLPATSIFSLATAPETLEKNKPGSLKAASYLRMESGAVEMLIRQRPDLLKLILPAPGGTLLDLHLERAEVFSPDFKVFTASDKSQAYDYRPGVFYWGIIDGQPESLTAITLTREEVSGLIHLEGKTFNLGRVPDKAQEMHVLYRSEDLEDPPTSSCFANDFDHYLENSKGAQNGAAEDKAADNCVRMYVEVDYDIYQGKGGVTQAANYVTAVFNQVAIMYANESIDFVLNELLVWDTPDPYTGPSTQDYLYQFRDNLGGNYNGDLAHLVGYQGSGGIAYINVLCNSFYGLGYSDINPTYSNVPTYSWTVEVVTHEIGHNLGSRHTHACVWNGNNTAIDGCGPAAGYSDGCDAPLPVKGTVMSYCHLVGGVGIDLSLGFGPQPGDLIRSRVSGASCLSPCTPPRSNDAAITAVLVPSGTLCTDSETPVVELTNFGTDPLTSVRIDYQLDGGALGSYNWTGYLANAAATQVNLPDIAFAPGAHVFEAATAMPNGQVDENPANDAGSGNFSRESEQVFYADNDNDGYGDPNNAILDCAAPSGYVSDNSDCNDNDGNAYPGAPCNDGDSCTTGDVLDANCNCTGTYTDSDNDGVCDGQDICPGGDDTIDSDNDGVPDDCDCNPATSVFSTDPLTHDGGESSIVSYTFEAGSKNASFTITGLDARLNGNPNNRFEEVVVISYVDGNGTNQSYGSFGGGSTASVNVSINGKIQSVAISLSDGYDGNAPQTLSVDLSSISYCGPDPGCPDADGDGVCDTEDICANFDDNLIGTTCDDGDACTTNDIYGNDCNCAGTYADSDGDGVCDAEDICPAGDDTLDSDGDGIPDACDPSNCVDEISDNFSPSTLTHSNSGSSISSVVFGATRTGVNFSISGLSAQESGKPDLRHIEEVTITYKDGSGTEVHYGTFNGASQGSVDVSIPGAVQSIQVSLSDAFDGNSASLLSVDISAATSCNSTPESLGTTSGFGEPELFPNPTTGNTTLRFGYTPERARVVVYNLLGAQVATYNVEDTSVLLLDTQQWATHSQVFLVTIFFPEIRITKRLVVMR